jgi:hypothetical protein
MGEVRHCKYGGEECMTLLTGPKHQRFCPTHARKRKQQCYANAITAVFVAEWRAKNRERAKELNRLHQRQYRERQRLKRAEQSVLALAA